MSSSAMPRYECAQNMLRRARGTIMSADFQACFFAFLPAASVMATAQRSPQSEIDYQQVAKQARKARPARAAANADE